MTAQSENSLTPTELDARTADLAEYIQVECADEPDGIALLALARVQAAIIMRNPQNADRALKGCAEMTRMYVDYLRALTLDGVTLLPEVPGNIA